MEHVKITLIWVKDGKQQKTKHKVLKEVWNSPNLDRISYCRGACQVLGGRFLMFKEN